MTVVLLASSCNRLTFVKPDTGRKGFERTAPDVAVGATANSRDAEAARAHLQLSKVRLLQGDNVTAESEARQALKLDPTSVDANTLLAVAKERSGDTKGAGIYYQRAIELAPGRGGPLNNYGTWLCASGKPAESLAWFDQALADPTYATPSAALANAGACADQAGQNARAERDLRRAIELDPNNAVALSAMAEREFRAGRAFEARAFSERRLSAAPADARSLQLASQIEEKLGDRTAAAKYVQRLRAEFPDARASGIGDEGKQ
jgi:type IV pilus assembly protein PilF